jgi:glycosyltransferase involved in cell wall biosynthesis
VDLAVLRDGGDSGLVEKLKSKGGTKWLFVGRLAPNKCQHDVVAAFAIYRRLYDPGATLTLVGSPTSYRYQRAVERIATDLGIGGAVEQVSGVGSRQLAAYYEVADVFVCMSEHEGFCAPIVESMASGLPVVAYAAGAVGETMGEAGLLLKSKDPLEVAIQVHDLLGDERRRSVSVDAGRTRAQQFSLQLTTPHFLKVVADWIGERTPTGQ